MLYTIAAVHRIEALAMMTVSDIVGATEDERERISDDELRRGVDDMMRVACRVAVAPNPRTGAAPCRCGRRARRSSPGRGGGRRRCRRTARSGLPVPAGLADLDEIDVDDVLAHRRHQVAEALDVGDPALPLGPLDHHRRVVAALDRLAEAAVAHRLGPAGEQVDVAAVVHQVGEPGPGRPGADLAEHHLARRRAVPLHVREPAREPHRRDHRLAHRLAAGEVRVVGVAVGDHLLADPLDLLADERPRPVLGDVVEGDRPPPRRPCRR